VPESVPWDTWAITTAMAIGLVAYFFTTILITKRGRDKRRAERDK
jgi:hypothetical protein